MTEAVAGGITAGQFIAFVSYNSMLAWRVRYLGRMVSEMSKAGVSLSRLDYILGSEEEHDRPITKTADMSGDIVFDHVSFGYTPETETLHDVSFTIPGGSTFAILGGTGSGKSTIMHLLNRLYDIPEGGGRITIGGVDIADMKASELREGIGMVLQEPFLFPARSVKISRLPVRTPLLETSVRRRQTPAWTIVFVSFLSAMKRWSASAA